MSFIMINTLFKALLLSLCFSLSAIAEEIGSVSTKFHLLTPNDKIFVEVFDDPRISGVSCYISSARRGGVLGTLHIKASVANASISCHKFGKVSLPDDIISGKSDGEEVFKKRLSLLFKTLQVVRFYDKKRNVLIYLTYSDKIIEGSPKNSISVVSLETFK